MDAFNSKTASKIAGVSLRQLQYWDERGFLRPSVRLSDGRGSKRLYSFSDLIQLKVVKDLTDHGFTLRKIRKCLLYLRRCHSRRAERPSDLRYLTDGEKLFLLTNDRKKILDAMEQTFVFSLGIGNLTRELDGQVRRLAANPLTENRKRGTSA